MIEEVSIRKNNLAELRKGRRGQFERDNNKIFDIVMTQLQLRFSTLRLKPWEVEYLIQQLLSSTVPWSNSLQSIGINTKPSKALFLKMNLQKYQDKFSEMLQKANVPDTCVKYFRNTLKTKPSKSVSRKRSKSKSPTRKCTDKSKLSTDNDYSTDEIVIPQCQEDIVKDGNIVDKGNDEKERIGDHYEGNDDAESMDWNSVVGK